LFLYEIFGIDIGLTSFFSFLFGIFIGLTISFLIYLLVIVRGMRNSKNLLEKETFIIDDNEIKIMVKQTEDMFNDRDLQGNLGNIEYAKNLITKMMTNIARKFFPNSKRPLAELSIDELLVLLKYISDRLDKVLDRRGIRIFRSLKLSTILGFSDVASKIEDNEILKATKKYKINETWRAVRSVTNVINPVFWARRFIVTKGQSMLIRKICLVTIVIVAEETYKIYSKSVFNIEKNIDTGANDIVDDIEDEISSSMGETLKENTLLDDKEEQISKDISTSEKTINNSKDDILEDDNKESLGLSIFRKRQSKFKKWFRKKDE